MTALAFSTLSRAAGSGDDISLGPASRFAGPPQGGQHDCQNSGDNHEKIRKEEWREIGHRVASAMAVSELTAVVTTVAVAVVTNANTRAKRMKILRM
jgi:hypothetical protein